MAVAVPTVPAAEPALSAPSRAPRLLLAALVALLTLAAFADGGGGVPEETRLQLALLVLAGVAATVWLYGDGLAFSASRGTWTGVGLLAAFAAWSGISTAWSVSPDRSWLEFNRGIAYAIVVVLGVGLGSSLPRAHARTCAAVALAVGLVALYALGSLLEPDPPGALSRLSAPLGDADALGLLTGLATLPCLAVSLDRARATAARLMALAATAVLLIVLVLTQSGGALVAVSVAVVVALLLIEERDRFLAWLAAAGLAMSAPVAVALSRDDLATDGLTLARREDDALLVLGTLLIALGGLVLLGRGLVALERRGVFSPSRDRWALVVLAVVALVVAVAALAGSGGGVAGAVDDFTRGNRWAWWQEAVGAWWDRPVAGWGAGAFSVPHELYRSTPLDVSQPHSMPLQWLAETGAVGLVLAAGGLLALIGAALGRVRELDGGRTAAAALAAGGVAWFVHALHHGDWGIPAVTLPMLLALGVAAGRPATAAPRPPAASGLGLSAVVAGLLVAAVLAALPALAVSRTERARELSTPGDASPAQLADAAAQAELGARLFPVAVEPLFATASVAQRIGDVSQTRRQLFRAIDRQPYSSEAWARLVRIDILRSDRIGIERSARRLLALDPLDAGVISLVGRAQAALTPPAGSATATGSPLPQEVPAAPVPVVP